MQHITDLLTGQGHQPQPSASRQSAQELQAGHPIWELWARMSEMFGHTWLRDQGDEPNDTWIRGLRDITAQQFGRGLTACRDSGSDFPPSLPKFRAMCLGETFDGTTAQERAAHKPFEPDRALEDITKRDAARKAGEAELAKMRAMFGGNAA